VAGEENGTLHGGDMRKCSQANEPITQRENAQKKPLEPQPKKPKPVRNRAPEDESHQALASSTQIGTEIPAKSRGADIMGSVMPKGSFLRGLNKHNQA